MDDTQTDQAKAQLRGAGFPSSLVLSLGSGDAGVSRRIAASTATVAGEIFDPFRKSVLGS
jgi:hypothetical protein